MDLDIHLDGRDPFMGSCHLKVHIPEQTGVKIDISDEGAVSICGTEKEMMDKAVKMIEIITTDFEAGQIFVGS